ncbi:MAG: M23 family metallopeptidase, partial [Microbacteriaceae bacterium]|nr:M23 family metallopeptidase [Microbacteriaceae bacterium]
EQPAEAQHRADLAAATQQQPAPQTLEVPADAESPQAAEAPAPELDADESSTSVEEFDVDGLVTAAQPIIVEEEEPTLAAAQAEEQGTSTGAAGLSSPVGPGTTLSSGYGYRAAPIAGAKPFHDGIDLSGSCGIPLYAVTSGTVTSTGWDGTYGERLDLRSDDGVTSFMYAHLQGYAVAPGQQVAAGDLVGWLGTTGLSTGCHLHFEVHVGGGSVDPLPWLAERGIHV